MAKFTNMDYRRALMLFLDDVSITDIAKQMDTSRQSVTKWKKLGLPEEITGGRDWEEFRQSERADHTRRAMVRAKEEETESSLEFFEKAKEDVRALFEEARSRLMAGEGKLNFSDVERLLNIFIRLDNHAADRVLWMQDVMSKMIRCVDNRVKDERIFLQVRNDFIQIAAGEQKKLGPIPAVVELPSPAEIVLGKEADEPAT